MSSEDNFASELSRWQAVTRRNPQADGKFLYAVATTGIYCRPICPSRMPKRENVRFFDTWQIAEAAGFRPCKRCTPRLPEALNETVEIVVRACEAIAQAEKEPSLAQLASLVNLSPYHFHRLFKKAVGMTPKQYAMEKRLSRMRDHLQQSATIADAVYEAGYQSNSCFYTKASESLGMKPSAYQEGGEGMSIRYAIAQSYLGWVLIAATDRGICRIDLDDSPEALQASLKAEFPKADLQDGDLEFETAIARTLAFLEAPDRGLELPLDIRGTAFQRQVWTVLQNIPPGSTASYTEIAQEIGKPTAARAVAQACAANKVAVVIPCHRVVRSDGKLAGYRWGIERKQAILKRESNCIDG